MTNPELITTTKCIGVTSLGLYAGLLTSTSLITSATPLDVLTGSLKNLLCKIGCWATAFGSVSTISLAVSYFLSEKPQRSNTRLAGALIAPITGLYLYASSLANHGCCPSKAKESGLPEGHPQVGADAPVCPFSKTTDDSNGSFHKGSIKSDKCYNALLCHLTVVTLTTCGVFAKSVFDGFQGLL